MLYCSYVKMHKGALTMKIKYLLMGTSLSLIPQTINAQCVATQDCATLGYTETSCSGGSGVKCPFGNKWACFQTRAEIEKEICTNLGYTLSCTGTGYASGVGKTCNGKYSECKCDDGYTWNDSSQKCEDATVNCVIGALYYADGTCSDKLESSKTLLGVVIYEKSTGENGWIMTVKPIATGIAWDTGSYYSTGITDKAVSASCTNTQKLVNLGSRFAAANKANSYKPSGTPSGKTWCLPSYDLLNNINNSVNLAKVNASITIAGGTILGNVYNGYEYVWSSSENSSYSAWEFGAGTSGSFFMYNGYGKNYNASYRSVRPVMAF